MSDETCRTDLVIGALLTFQEDAEHVYPGWKEKLSKVPPVPRRQAEEAWMFWKLGMWGDVSWTEGILEYAKTHAVLWMTFLAFRQDADKLYPGWQEKLGDSINEDLMNAWDAECERYQFDVA